MNRCKIIITCDGPAASGKSTIAKLVAQKLNIAFLSSGWFYRALAYLLLTYEHYSLETLIDATEEHIKYYLHTDNVRYEYRDGQAFLYFKNKNITPYLKDVIIDKGSILLSPRRYVRDVIMNVQRDFAQHTNCIIEGRDCGSVVFPQAEYKFYITSSLTIRAARWNSDQRKRGNNFTQEEAERLLADRDERDKKRIYGALVVPYNAIIIDTTTLTLSEAVKIICSNITC